MTNEARAQQQDTMPGMALGEEFGTAPNALPNVAPSGDLGQEPDSAMGAAPDVAPWEGGAQASYVMPDTAPAQVPETQLGMVGETQPGAAPDFAYEQTANPLPNVAPVQASGAAAAMMPDDSPNQVYDEVREYQQAVTPQSNPLMPDRDPVQIRAITVRTGRLVVDVEIPEMRFRYTTPRLSAFANGQYPDLPHHACVNEVGNTFGYVMEKTSIAHLLEHLVISEQVRATAADAITFVGTTEWMNESLGIARIEVGFKDDLVALRAFNDATRFLNMAVLTCLV